MLNFGLSPLGRFNQRSPSAVSWWLAGGVSSSACAGAYQAKGAANLSASYVNLANPGTNNLELGVAPTWTMPDGWTFNGTSQYLKTKIVPANDQSWSMIARFSGYTTDGRYICGSAGSGSTRFYLAQFGGSLYGNGSQSLINQTIVQSAVMCVSGASGYWNGNVQVSNISPWAGSAFAIYIGCRNISGAAGSLMAGNIQAVAIYNSVLSAAQVLAITNAMNAL